jgi:NTE family protein
MLAAGVRRNAGILAAVTSSRAVRPRCGALCIGASMLCLAASSLAVAQTTPDPPPPTDSSAAPDARPRVGLVLSGGGARGTAHIGVLKVLDELKVPVDAIAGTSMGAVVGGLYASGLSGIEIEKIMSTLDWQDAFRDRPPRADLTFRRKQEDQNFLVKFPLGLRSGRFLLPKGLVQGQKLNQTLRRLTLPVAHVASFDDLPVPFRAVATDLETGAAVIISDGDLTSAMRASLSAPGVFAPVEREGRLLVDGGLVENLPIDVVRQMGVDVIIVVDVSFPLMARERLNSVPTISNQMLAILIRKDSEAQKKTLGPNDIVIDPKLGEASSFDFTIVKRVIEAGEKAAREMQPRLAALTNPPEAAERYAARREASRKPPPRIDFVRVQPGSERYAESLNNLFDGTIGEPLDSEELAERVTGYYGKGNLEALDYEVVTDEMGRRGLALTARRNSWGPNYVRFGLNLQDDFEGNSSYNAAARFVLSEITQPGGEWVWDLQVGESSRIATEIYLPVSQSSPYFLLPHAQFGARNVTVLEDQRPVAEYRLRSFIYGVDYGREFGNWGEIRAGLRREIGSTRVRVGDPTLPTDDFDVREYFLRLAYDRLDDVNFPHRGQLASLEWRGERTGLGSERAADRLAFDWLGARSWGRHTAVLWASLGTALDDEVGDVRTLFPLGGFFNLSGLRADSLTGRHFGIARFLYYKQIGRGGPGFLDVPAYLGLSLEAGNVWEQRSDASFDSARKNASLYLGLDTLLGPVYLGAGYDESGQEAFYLFLGRTF